MRDLIYLMCVCEVTCVCAHAQVGKRDVRRCPHRMFVKRKPEPLGVEMKTIGDALSGLILRLEIVRGKAEVVKLKFYVPNARTVGERVGATPAQTLRLSEPWFGTRRVVAGTHCSVLAAYILAWRRVRVMPHLHASTSARMYEARSVTCTLYLHPNKSYPSPKLSILCDL